MNNFMSTATRRHGDPALVSLAYPSSHPGSNASLVPGAPAARSPGTAVRERSNEGVAKPDWLGEWEEEWGEAEDWGAEIGHTLKLAVLAPITTWGILGQAIVGAGDPIDWTPLEEDEAARRTERDVYRRQRAAKRVQEREAVRMEEEAATRCHDRSADSSTPPGVTADFDSGDVSSARASITTHRLKGA